MSSTPPSGEKDQSSPDQLKVVQELVPPGSQEAQAGGLGFSNYRTTIASGVAVMLVMMAAQRLIGFTRGILFCRWLEPFDLGQWDITYGFLMLAAPVTVLGLPGSFGRYFEHYRQRNLLGLFLKRTTLLTVCLSSVGILVMSLNSEFFSGLIYGQVGFANLVFWTTLCLGTVVLHNYLISLFIAARMYRTVSLLQFFQGVFFALFGLAALAIWHEQANASFLIIAFGLSCLVSSALCLPAIVSVRQEARHYNTSTKDHTPGHWSFWNRLIPFVIWIWITNLLTGLFELADRYLIIHYSGRDEIDSMAMVGNYHSSRLIPLLFVSVATMISSAITPHLSNRWESGDRQSVSDQLNLAIKLLSSVLFLASVAVLAISPWLFGSLLQDKFSGGLEILPWTLAYCSWFSLLCIGQNYLWCAEKAALGSVPLFIGLVINVILGILLLPTFGLLGAVWATSFANLAAMILLFLFNALKGMQIHTSTWLIAFVPMALGFGLIPSGLTFLICLAFALGTNWLFSASEKNQIKLALIELREKITKIIAGLKPSFLRV